MPTFRLGNSSVALLGGVPLVVRTPLCNRSPRGCVVRDRRLLHPALLFPGRYKRASPSPTHQSVEPTKTQVASSYSGKEQLKKWTLASVPRVSIYFCHCLVLVMLVVFYWTNLNASYVVSVLFSWNLQVWGILHLHKLLLHHLLQEK